MRTVAVVFTADNDAAYALSRDYLVMPITCEIGRRERDRMFDLFRAGAIRALVSSRVLNEGLDFPEADVAIIVGGNHGERELIYEYERFVVGAAPDSPAADQRDLGGLHGAADIAGP